MRRIKSKGKLESARRTLQSASAVSRYTVAKGPPWIRPDPRLRSALAGPMVTHHGAAIEPARVGELLRSIVGYEGQPVSKLAMQLGPHVFLRTARFWTKA